MTRGEVVGRVRENISNSMANGIGMLRSAVSSGLSSIMNNNVGASGGQPSQQEDDDIPETVHDMIVMDAHKLVLKELESGRVQVNRPDSRGRTLLHFAASLNSLECMALLIKHKSNVDAQDSFNGTALLLAARNGHRRCMEILIKANADPNHADASGMTSSHWLAANGRPEALLSWFNDYADFTVRENHGQTPLHFAARNGHSNVVALLLSWKIDPNCKSNNGQTPLLESARSGQARSVELLCNGGALPFPNDAGETPILIAAQNGHRSVVGVLVKAFPDSLQHLVEVLQRDDVPEPAVLGTLRYLCQDKECCEKTLSHLASTAQVSGKAVLSLRTDALQTSTSFLRLMRAILLLWEDIRKMGNMMLAHSAGCKAAADLDPLWQVLNHWLMLKAQEELGIKVTDDDNEGGSDGGGVPHENLTLTSPSSSSSLSSLPSASMVIQLVPSSSSTSDPIAFRLFTVLHGFCLWCSINSDLNQMFDSFVLKHQAIIARWIAANPQLILDCLSPLLENIPISRKLGMETALHTLPLQQRRDWMYQELDRLAAEISASASATSMFEAEDDPDFMVVERGNAFQQSCGFLMTASPSKLRSALNVRFKNEAGMGAGVLREWFGVLSSEILNPHYALFIPSSDSCTFQPNPQSHVNPDHLNYFHFAGRIIGLAICHRQVLDVYFTRCFYKNWLQVEVDIDDVASLDVDFYRSLQWLLDNPIGDLDLEIFFTVESCPFGAVERVNLIPNGNNILVTDENKIEYARKVSQFKMRDSIQAQIQAFVSGLHEFVPHRVLCALDHYELELVVSGVPSLDVDDWQKNTVYSGFAEDDEVVVWFWSIVRSKSQHDRALILQFATGSSRVPIGGFAGLMGAVGPQKFTLSKIDGDDSRLPTASTCFNLLKIPRYSTRERLEHALEMAYNHASRGFDFA